MTKSHLTPEQRFKQLFNLSLDKSATPKEREAAERKWEEWLKRHDKTRLDIPEILADAVEHDKAAKAANPPPDPRDHGATSTGGGTYSTTQSAIPPP